jgi:molybdenum cofactor cytidylyltransferase
MDRAKGISAILLAAGESRRMGQPKLILPWQHTTVLGQVVEAFSSAGLEEIMVVTGGARLQVEAEVTRLARAFPVRSIFNPDFEQGGMVSSIQTGLSALAPQVLAALVGLGDQPQVLPQTVRRVCAAFLETDLPLVFPSFQGRRGHPWLAACRVWPELLALPPASTPRQFFRSYNGQIAYVDSDESILMDLDTPEEYHRQRH